MRRLGKHGARLLVMREQFCIVQHKILPCATLHQVQLLLQHVAGARGLHRIGDGGLALFGELVKRKIRVYKRNNQRQNGQRKAY